MALKKLSYPALDGEGSVNNRLSKSHEHANKDQIDQIDNAFLKRVAEELVDVDLSNLDPQILKEAVQLSGAGFPEAPESTTDENIMGFVRRVINSKGYWIPLSKAQTVIEIDESEADSKYVVVDKEAPSQIVGDNTVQWKNRYTIDLAPAAKAAIDAVDNKSDKPLGDPVEDALIVSKSDGTLSYASVTTPSLLLKSQLVTDPKVSGNSVPAAATAVNEVYRKVNQLISGISSCKGCVVNAYKSQGVAVGISKLNVVDGGSGYNEGDLISISTPKTIIPVIARVTAVDIGGGVQAVSVDAGSISAIEISTSNSGFYNTAMKAAQNVDDESANYKVIGGNGTGAILQVVHTISVANSCLPDPYSVTVGDTMFVMQDETHDESPSIYVCTSVTFEDGGSRNMWIYVATVNSNTSIKRYQ